ncbi:FSTL3 protein, partial [Dromaius novaehollandiae]|nr:FSTL3 protein [Dromaius novaehollandiae]
APRAGVRCCEPSSPSSSSALAAGGICWLQQGKEAKCTMILKTGVTWEDCCANGNVDVAWSNYTYPGNKISLLGFLGLVTCHPCKGEGGHGPPGESGAPRDAAGRESAGSRHCARTGAAVPWTLPGTMLCARGPGSSGSSGAAPEPGQTLQQGRAGGAAAVPRQLFALCVFICFVVCPGTHTCVVDQTGSAHCVTCRTAPCPEPAGLDRALCGNNNVTYPSACHLRRATCHLGRSIGVRHYGSCSAAAKFSVETDSAKENYV